MSVYRDKMGDLGALLGETRSSLTDDQVAAWADKRERLKQAASDSKVSWPYLLSVLTRLTIKASQHTGCTDATVGQLQILTGLSERQVQRCLDALKQAGLLADVRRGGGRGDRARGTERQLLFLTPLKQGTHATETGNSRHLVAPSTESSTEPPTAARASWGQTAATGSGSGGGNEARKQGSDWGSQLAVNAARQSVSLKPDGIRNAEAVARSREAAARSWVEALKQRSDWSALSQLSPDDTALVGWCACELADGPGGGNYHAAEAIRRAQQLTDQTPGLRLVAGH